VFDRDSNSCVNSSQTTSQPADHSPAVRQGPGVEQNQETGSDGAQDPSDTKNDGDNKTDQGQVLEQNSGLEVSDVLQHVDPSDNNNNNNNDVSKNDQGQVVEQNQEPEGSDLQLDDPSDNKSDDVIKSDDANKSDDDNDDGFPLWLLILIIVLAVLAAIIATWLIYRCCKKEPESDIEEASAFGERDSFVAACANSEMQVMAGIACAEGAKTHVSAVDPNWSPSDDSITARRTTPSPDRSNVIRQGQVVEYV
jgi:hypothetical protein